MSLSKINNKDIRKTKRIYVEWVDSTAIRGWQHNSQFDESFLEASIICSFGYLVGETQKEIMISTSVSINGNAMDPLIIPKVAITKKRFVK